ncbi:MAG: hypothetical protein JO033_07415 [Acidobacteriaceae bacterium]|nr:hypothetical protein [Acidobacteriaceae bacterium]
MSEAALRQLIVCAGNRIAAACAQAMEDFSASQQGNRCEFSMSEWLDETQFRQAALLWIVDDSQPWNTVHFALQNQIALLVPADNIPMRQLCINASCGVFFQDAADVRACLEFLLTNEVARTRMGANGRAYVTPYFYQGFRPITA